MRTVQSELRNEMTKLYLMFTEPYLISDTKTGEIIEQSIQWTNQEAEALFLNLQAMLIEYQTKELKQYNASVRQAG